MKPEEIKPGGIYIGGKNDEVRAVVEFGASERWVLWAPERERLPLGGFVRTRTTERKSFAKWARRVR